MDRARRISRRNPPRQRRAAGRRGHVRRDAVSSRCRCRTRCAAMIAAHLGPAWPLTAAAGTNYDWWQEFFAQASGLGTTFVPSIIGFGAVLDNLSGLLDNNVMAATIAGVTAHGWCCGRFSPAASSIGSRARRRTRSHGFFGACGMHFWRLLRLGVFALVVYAFLFGYVHDWIFDVRTRGLTRDVTAERTAFAIRLAGYAMFGALLPSLQPRLRLRSRPHRRRGSSQRPRRARRRRARFVRRHAARCLAALCAECRSIPVAGRAVRRGRSRARRDRACRCG